MRGIMSTQIRIVGEAEKKIINQIVLIHLGTFQGFFLTSLGQGFLRQMYQSYCEENNSGLFVALDCRKPIGFLAYSSNLGSLYKYMIRKRLIPFAWYSLIAFFRNPKVFMRLIRAFLKPSESKRNKAYVELASIGVDPQEKTHGIGSMLIKALIDIVDFEKYAYITLETDAINNDSVNLFYKKNGFLLEREFTTREGRKLNEYRYKPH